MAGQRRVGPPAAYRPARRGLPRRRDRADRSPAVAADRGDYRVASAEVLGVADGRRPGTGTVDGAIEPLDGGRRSRVTIALDFEGYGIGRLLVPFVVRRQVRR